MEIESSAGPRTRDGRATALQTCPLCEAACGLEISLEAGIPVRVRGDSLDPASRGYLCPKGASLVRLHEDPDRLSTPRIRRNGRLEPVSWDEGVAHASELLRRFVDEHGRAALGTFTGNPAAYSIGLLLSLPQLFRAIGGERRFSSMSLDVLPKHYIAALMYGHNMSVPVPDIDRTSYFLVLGANPLVSNGSVLTAPNMARRVKELQGRGGRMVVIDPHRTKTAAAADEHHPIRPGTDVWLLASLVRTVLVEHVDGLSTRLAPFTRGFETVRDAVHAFTPEKAEVHCGIDARAIRRIARDLVTAPTAAVYGRIGTTLQREGTLVSWLIDVLNIITDNLDKPGGVVFATAVTEPVRGPSWLRSEEADRGRFVAANGMPETLGELPAAALADEVLTGADDRMRGLIVVAGNPAVSIPGSTKVNEALSALDLLISVDNYVNETSRHADVILPGPSPLERSHFPFIARFSAERYARWTPAVLPAGARPSEWQLIWTLAAAVSGSDTDVDVADDAAFARRIERAVQDPQSAIFGRDPGEIIASYDYGGPDRFVDFLLRTGRDGDAYGARPGGLSLESLIEHPHGVVLGPSIPQLPDILVTRSAKIELAPPIVVAALASFLTESAGDAATGDERSLTLIGRRNLRSNNSWMHNIPTLVRGRPQCTAMLNPVDATRAGIVDGQMIDVISPNGRVRLPAEVTEDILEGVISIPHGWGHDQQGMELSVAAAVPGANSNVLGSTDAVERITSTALSTGVEVTVRPSRDG